MPISDDSSDEDWTKEPEEPVRFEPCNFPMPEGVGSAIGKPLPQPDPFGEESDIHIFAKARLIADKRLEGRMEKEVFVPLEHISNLKQKATDYFLDGQYEEAQSTYEDAGSLLLRHFFKYDKGVATENVEGTPAYEEASLLLAVCYLNSCQCLLKIADSTRDNDMATGCRRRIVWHAKIAMAHDPCSNCKALYRRGLARMGLKEWQPAINDLTKAIKLEPNNKILRKALNDVYKEREAEKLREKETFTFDKLKSAIERKEPKPKFVPPGTEYDHLEFLRTQKKEAVDIEDNA